jgi:ribosomal protein S17
MHCSVIRISLYHYHQEEKFQVNPLLKNLLKTKGFKWKTVTNEATTGSRVEIMECNNMQYKE